MKACSCLVFCTFFFHENLGFLSWEHKSKSITTKALKISLRSESLGSPPWMVGTQMIVGYWLVESWDHHLSLFLLTKLKDFKSFWIRFYALFHICWVSGKNGAVWCFLSSFLCFMITYEFSSFFVLRREMILITMMMVEIMMLAILLMMVVLTRVIVMLVVMEIMKMITETMVVVVIVVVMVVMTRRMMIVILN